jgi:hypothetical protein
MSDQAENIRTPQLRFKVAAGGHQINSKVREEPARQPTIVEEQNLAALFQSSVDHPAANEKSVQRPWIFI